jgi:uroporphyrinogen III methyltransferase/synthase
MTLPAADTLVILMGIANARAMCDRLIAAGRSVDTPAAAIEWGTTDRQRVAAGTLSTLPDLIVREAIGAPAVIVVGETVRLRPMLEWFDPHLAAVGAGLQS